MKQSKRRYIINWVRNTFTLFVLKFLSLKAMIFKSSAICIHAFSMNILRAIMSNVIFDLVRGVLKTVISHFVHILDLIEKQLVNNNA